jgi:hypothetical protein
LVGFGFLFSLFVLLITQLPLTLSDKSFSQEYASALVVADSYLRESNVHYEDIKI